ncbi:hypothetical protein BJ138DRAFT_1166071 [Hygrophoropsis aurantiaca]|uniref:Uncharacterized protein n=1 Tax=Hygrophoropsis aurantiaca TaxID=72124 RepID=A0ACB7ZVP1_9AGAM|nr:hypothetical protein BJ138DRAFT_1166071 [Hygrophoropsis aurantiaca]
MWRAGVCGWTTNYRDGNRRDRIRTLLSMASGVLDEPTALDSRAITWNCRFFIWKNQGRSLCQQLPTHVSDRPPPSLHQKNKKKNRKTRWLNLRSLHYVSDTPAKAEVCAISSSQYSPASTSLPWYVMLQYRAPVLYLTHCTPEGSLQATRHVDSDAAGLKVQRHLYPPALPTSIPPPLSVNVKSGVIDERIESRHHWQHKHRHKHKRSDAKKPITGLRIEVVSTARIGRSSAGALTRHPFFSKPILAWKGVFGMPKIR